MSIRVNLVSHPSTVQTGTLTKMPAEIRKAVQDYRDTLNSQVNSWVRHIGHDKKVEKIKVLDRLLALDGTMPLKDAVAQVKQEFANSKLKILEGQTLQLLDLVARQVQPLHEAAPEAPRSSYHP